MPESRAQTFERVFRAEHPALLTFRRPRTPLARRLSSGTWTLLLRRTRPPLVGGLTLHQ